MALHVAMWAAVGLYGVAAAYLILYGLHMYVLTGLFRRRYAPVGRAQVARIDWYSAERPDADWPFVTTQIPLYDEANVARRVIEAACAMDYPSGLHEIQVLDDSDDETREAVDETAAAMRAVGHDVVVVRRRMRTGYKAGALAEGLRQARGELVAVFDADFVPPRDFLRRAVPLLMDEPNNACVQGRWSHMNEDRSWLTRAQALAIDGHFGVEQGGRCWNDLLMNFNGTAGIWRRAAIDDPAVGGWTADTLTEDLDLSYRVQLAGWKLEYCMDLACPSELPETVQAVKVQQYRWAKGSIQCARKLLPRIWRSGLPMGAKLEATMHLTGYSISVWMLVLGLLGLPMSWINPFAALGGWVLVIAGMMWLSLSGPPVAHAVSRRAIRGSWGGLRASPLLMLLGVGLCLNTTRACLSGLFSRGGEFVRTPKRGSQSGSSVKRYAARPSKAWMLELAASAYCMVGFAYFLVASEATVGAFAALFAVGFGIVGWQGRPRGRNVTSPTPAALGSATASAHPAIGAASHERTNPKP